MLFKQKLMENMELVMRIAEERAFQAEGAAPAKSLRWEWAWFI